jgi:pimeloyl-ACP methyl ester carboxylesterase
MSSGLIVVLPGIEGRSSLSRGIVQGLVDAGSTCAITTYDWTTGVWPFFLYHLRAERRNRRNAQAVGEMIVDYQSKWPGRPVFLVGHSGGGALAVWVLEWLSGRYLVDAAILLAPALAPNYNLATALSATRRGIWNYYSWLDVLYLAAGTFLFGTIEGRHCVAAGNRGFVQESTLSLDERTLYQAKLQQQRYTFSMLNRFHTGGHFGWANRVFVAETVAPILCADTLSRVA